MPTKSDFSYRKLVSSPVFTIDPMRHPEGPPSNVSHCDLQGIGMTWNLLSARFPNLANVTASMCDPGRIATQQGG
jgi:hypothetical protein